LSRRVLINAMLRDQTREINTVDTTRQIMASRNRQERARVVVESDGVVEAGCFGGVLAEAQHAFRAVVEPPGRTELQRRVMSCERRQLTAVHRLIEREQNDAQRLAVTEAIEQRTQRL